MRGDPNAVVPVIPIEARPTRLGLGDAVDRLVAQRIGSSQPGAERTGFSLGTPQLVKSVLTTVLLFGPVGHRECGGHRFVRRYRMR